MSRTFHSLFKVLFIFRSHYLFAIGLGEIFSLRRSTPAVLDSILKLPDSWGAENWHGCVESYGTIALLGCTFLCDSFD